MTKYCSSRLARKSPMPGEVSYAALPADFMRELAADRLRIARAIKPDHADVA
jgi:hypothetical protein